MNMIISKTSIGNQKNKNKRHRLKKKALIPKIFLALLLCSCSIWIYVFINLIFDYSIVNSLIKMIIVLLFLASVLLLLFIFRKKLRPLIKKLKKKTNSMYWRIRRYLFSNRFGIKNTLIYIVWLLILILIPTLFYLGIFDENSIIDVIKSIFIAAIPTTVTYLLLRKKEIMLLTAISQYFIEGDQGIIDDILGKMISHKVTSFIKVEPISVFFSALKRICITGEYRQRRRIAEALPVLIEIDFKKTEELMNILRSDIDTKWRTDIRRRTIEGLPQLLNRDPLIVKKFLEIQEDDEIYTLIAIVEIIHLLKKDEEGPILLNKVKAFAMKNYGKKETDSLDFLVTLLDLIDKNLQDVIEEMEQSKNSNNLFIQICVARHIPSIANNFPRKFLEFSKYFIQGTQDKNVRRPIAKENCISRLLKLLKNPKYNIEVKDVIWSLLKDDDEIIRITTFDKIDEIFDIDRDFAKKIDEYLINNEKNEELKERALRWKKFSLDQ